MKICKYNNAVMDPSQMNRRRFLKNSCAYVPMVSAASCTRMVSDIPVKRPNIIMIMSDDMGYSDLGCYGGEIQTPNLDRLASQGLRFTRYYTNNMCVPTRASLMSGCYTNKALGEDNKISHRVVTAAEVLQADGYSTYMSGKWHLSSSTDQTNMPCQRGYDQFFGTIIGAGSFWSPATLMVGNEPAEHLFEDPGFYYTDAITDHALDYMQDGLSKEDPFFLYVAYTSAHWPLHAYEEDVQEYSGKYSKGWDTLRVERHTCMKELGVINPDWALSPRHPDVPSWEQELNKDWQQRRMEVYAAQVTRMDHGIGRLLDQLEASGVAENTLVVFQIDNGGCHVEYTPDRKGQYLPEHTRDGRLMKPGNLPDIMPGPEDTYQSYGYGWANLSNTPFRLFKQHDHEGGIMVPLIVRWPEFVQQPGGLTDQLAHVIDLMPTFMDAAGTAYPSEFQGNPIHPADGKSLLPILRNELRQQPEMLFWRWNHGRAVRQGQWKLVAVRDQPWELYDLDKDGTELHNLATRMPEKVIAMEQLWNKWHAGPEDPLSTATL